MGSKPLTQVDRTVEVKEVFLEGGGFRENTTIWIVTLVERRAEDGDLIPFRQVAALSRPREGLQLVSSARENTT